MIKFIVQNKKLILLLVFLGVFIFSSLVLATGERELLAEWPPSPTGRELTAESTLTDLVSYLYEWGIALGGLVAFIALIIAGFLYMTSVGDPGKMKEATSRIKSAFLGLAFLLASWLILTTINPDLTVVEEITLERGAAMTLCKCPAREACEWYACPDCDPNFKCVGYIPAQDGQQKQAGHCFPIPEEVKVYDCYRVTLYRHPDFTGRFQTIYQGEFNTILEAPLWMGIRKGPRSAQAYYRYGPKVGQLRPIPDGAVSTCQIYLFQGRRAWWGLGGTVCTGRQAIVPLPGEDMCNREDGCDFATLVDYSIYCFMIRHHPVDVVCPPDPIRPDPVPI